MLCGKCNKPKKKDAKEGEEFCKCGAPDLYYNINKTPEDWEHEIKGYIDKLKISEVNGKKMIELTSNEGLAMHLGLGLSTITKWSKDVDEEGNYVKPEFAKAFEDIKAKQKWELLNYGLNDIYNSTIAKLGLSSNHGMTDRVDATTKGEKFEGTTVYLPKNERMETTPETGEGTP